MKPPPFRNVEPNWIQCSLHGWWHPPEELCKGCAKEKAACADSAKPPETNSPAPSPLPESVPTSSLVEVIERNSIAMENVAFAIKALMEVLDPDGLAGEDEADLDRPQYLNSRPGRG